LKRREYNARRIDTTRILEGECGEENTMLEG
jgi:hypothetical protein